MAGAVTTNDDKPPPEEWEKARANAMMMSCVPSDKQQEWFDRCRPNVLAILRDHAAEAVGRVLPVATPSTVLNVACSDGHHPIYFSSRGIDHRAEELMCPACNPTGEAIAEAVKAATEHCEMHERTWARGIQERDEARKELKRENQAREKAEMERDGALYLAEEWRVLHVKAKDEVLRLRAVVRRYEEAAQAEPPKMAPAWLSRHSEECLSLAPERPCICGGQFVADPPKPQEPAR
jgi:hypothetical protein